ACGDSIVNQLGAFLCRTSRYREGPGVAGDISPGAREAGAAAEGGFAVGLCVFFRPKFHNADWSSLAAAGATVCTPAATRGLGPASDGGVKAVVKGAF